MIAALPLLFVVGSSNAAGMGASTYRADPSGASRWRSPPTSWLGRLAADLPGVRILNLSRSGADSTWALERARAACEAHAPRFLLFCPNPISDNDDGSAFLRNAGDVVALCRTAGVEPILRGAYAWNGYGSARLAQMLALNEALLGVVPRLLDHMSCLADERGHFIEGGRFHVDGLHPSDAGHARLHEAALASPALAGLAAAG